MTFTLGTNENNDIYLGADGNIVTLSGLSAVEAACATATKAQLGEMIYATAKGIPNFQALWVGVPDYNIWRSYILNTLLAVDGVQQVTSLDLQISGNTVKYTANITTAFGNGTING